MNAGIPAKENTPWLKDLAYRAVTLVKNQNLPFNPKAGARLFFAGQDLDFIQLARARYPNAQTFAWSFEPFYSADPTVIQEVSQRARTADHIVFCLTNPNSLQVLQALEPWKDKIIVLSSLTPIYLSTVPWVQDAIAMYGWDRTSFEAAFDALSGAVQAPGKLPINLP
jgi:beta-N-acetylhexosaminidase